MAMATGESKMVPGWPAKQDASEAAAQIGSSTTLVCDGAATEKLVSAQHEFSDGHGGPDGREPAGATTALPT
jgi:hypothetical protein